MRPEPFTFGIPLIARAGAKHWGLVEALLGLTLSSLRAQTDPDYRIILCGHDPPRQGFADHRVGFLEADWPAEPVRPDNLDSGRKKRAIEEFVLAQGGGLLMFLDADDWVDLRLVETARAMIGRQDIGGLVGFGFATDLRDLRFAALPDARLSGLEFHQLCGSSTIARLQPRAGDRLRRDPYQILHEHYRWPEVAAAHGASIIRLPVSGNYVVNTSENHSETHGPFAPWRRDFASRIGIFGHPLDEAATARFGLRLEEVIAVASAIRQIPAVPHKTTRQPSGSS